MFQVRLSSPYFVNPSPASAPVQSGAAGASVSAGSSAQVGSFSGEQSLSAEAKKQVDQLSQTDRKVRVHEQAHMAAGGELILNGPSYSYQKGPDGKMYAVGGDVSIDTSPGRTPSDTISRAQRIRSAALAPVDPSAQDRQVAATASNMEMNANRELAASQQRDASSENGERRNGGASGDQSFTGGQMQAFYMAVEQSNQANSTFATSA